MTTFTLDWHHVLLFLLSLKHPLRSERMTLNLVGQYKTGQWKFQKSKLTKDRNEKSRCIPVCKCLRQHPAKIHKSTPSISGWYFDFPAFLKERVKWWPVLRSGPDFFITWRTSNHNIKPRKTGHVFKRDIWRTAPYLIQLTGTGMS